ncbi:MAG: hypothetical protein KDD60_12230, partial [Bdellovibrionales bacterium]|nr:hypothetical protein [Bdellovibrionales bacterium]
HATAKQSATLKRYPGMVKPGLPWCRVKKQYSSYNYYGPFNLTGIKFFKRIDQFDTLALLC